MKSRKINLFLSLLLVFACFTPRLGGSYYYGAASAGGGGSAPVFDAASSTSGQSLGSPFTVTFSHTCTGSNRALYVVAGAGDGGLTTTAVITGITYNGAALSKIIHRHDGNFTRIELWHLIAPATGANNVVVTYTGGVNQYGCGAVSFTGVHQTTDVGTAAENSALTGDPSVTVTSAANEVVIVGCASDAQNTLAETGSLTRRWIRLNVGSDTDYGSGTYPGAAPNVTPAYDIGATEPGWSMVGVSIKGL